MEQSSLLEVLEQCRVCVPPDFNIPQVSLPLNFFDLFWLPRSPVQRLFFYSYNKDTTHFLHTTLPNIKHSLSLTLEHFFPLAGTLTWPLQSMKPIINCSQDNSVVTLTVAESSLDFNNLIGNHARDANEFYPLVPYLSAAKTQTENPLMALQVTVFPNTGICIGISVLHVIADGKTTNIFMKSWASRFRSGLGDTSCSLHELLPSFDRTVINDPNHLESTYLSELAKLDNSQQSPPKLKPLTISQVRATFVLLNPEIQKIKRFILDRFDEMYNKDVRTTPPLHLSTFVVTCAYVWVCLVKLKVVQTDQDVDGETKEHFLFAVDCRERLNPPIPATYFGTCVMPCFLDVNRNDLVGENGIVIAAEAIGSAIQRMSRGVLIGMENLFNKVEVAFKQGALSIAGSPKLAVYDTDFGWGKPKKVEVVSIEENEAMSLSECQDGNGGLEVGLVLSKFEMDAFTSYFRETLKVLSSSVILS